MTIAAETGPKTWTHLDARERRVVGVLVEKQKTTPENYPLSIAAIVTGCNQKSNREPVTNYDADDVEDVLASLRQKGAAVLVEGSGRVPKWKHAMYNWLDLLGKPVEMAILAELLLRGSQTEGDLRSRAARMDPIADLATLQAHLATLAARGLVVTLTPPGLRRGVVVTHGLYSPAELDRERHKAATAEADEPRASSPSGEPSLRAEVDALKARVDAMAAEIRELRQLFA